MNGRAPPRALPSQKGGTSPTPPVPFTPSFALLPCFSHPSDPLTNVGGSHRWGIMLLNLNGVPPGVRRARIYLPAAARYGDATLAPRCCKL